jgi:hypothetical protein
MLMTIPFWDMSLYIQLLHTNTKSGDRQLQEGESSQTVDNAGEIPLFCGNLEREFYVFLFE